MWLSFLGRSSFLMLILLIKRKSVKNGFKALKTMSQRVHSLPTYFKEQNFDFLCSLPAKTSSLVTISYVNAIFFLTTCQDF
jgi:hypothetical protein